MPDMKLTYKANITLNNQLNYADTCKNIPVLKQWKFTQGHIYAR